MKRMGLAICVAAFAVFGGIAMSEDMDVRALQAKLAAQEARLNDLQAKMYGASCDEQNVADGITSLRKNAVVTIGGTVNTRYFYREGEIKSTLVAGQAAPLASRAKVMDRKAGDMRVSDAKLEVKIDVNEYFDAYLKVDLQDGNFGRAGAAQNYWVRWKNVCNTGFGLVVGRDTLKFGGVTPYGVIGSFVKNYDGAGDVLDVFGQLGGGASAVVGGAGDPVAYGEGMFMHGNMVPAHTIWDHSRTTQINPYWENQDGSFKAELSLIQAIDTMNGTTGRRIGDEGFTRKYRSVNYGLGSGTFRMTWKPIEGLKLVASAMNLHAKNGAGRWNWRQGNAWTADVGLNGIETADNNFAANFGFEYRPCFFNRLNIWATYTHGWNEAWVKDQDSDSLSYGFGLDLTDQLTFFAQGDYLRVKNDQGQIWHKSTGWAGYAGLIYTLPYGVNLEAGYRHEQFTYKDRAGNKHTKAKADTIYAHLGFNF